MESLVLIVVLAMGWPILGIVLVAGMIVVLIDTGLAIKNKIKTTSIQFGLGSLFTVTTIVAVLAAVPATGCLFAFVGFLMWVNLMADFWQTISWTLP
jgi:hypothetical protein